MSDKAGDNQIGLAPEMNVQITLLEEKLRESEQIVAALQDSEKRYRRLFESAKDGILILDAETGKVVDVNPFLLQLLGYPYEAICGQFIWELGCFKDIAASKEAFKALQDNEYIRYENLPLETRTGQSLAVEFISNVYMVDHSKVIQCNIRDITARRRAEKALAESKAKTRSILDNISMGVALISPQMEVLELNDRMREWNPAYNHSGQHPNGYRAPNDPRQTEEGDNGTTAKTLKDGRVHEETRKRKRDGQMRHYRIVSSPIFNELGEVTAAIEMVEDVTEQLSMETNFRQARKMEAVGQLAGGVAHDFNNMLSVILGRTELALRKVDPSQPLHADLEEIHLAAIRSAEITRQLLAFARKQTIEPRVLDLNQSVEGMFKMLRRLIGEDIDLAWLPAVERCPIKMDPVQVDQVLANLCVNARDALADVGKVTIETKTVVIDESYCALHDGFVAGDYVLLEVSDDGCGMDKETLERIFEPFYTSKGLGQGTGLGLSTVYGIVMQNNGFINVYSEPRNGTTFRIYLPRFEGEAVEAMSATAAEIPLGRGETVLVVEDEPAILSISKKMLEDLGYRVLAAGTPGAAIRLAGEQTGKIHMLITDVVLPEMNGRELAERLQVLYPGLINLFMSGYPANVIARRGVLDEGVNFIQKPFSMQDLGAKMHNALSAAA